MNYLHYMLLWCAWDISRRIPSTRLLGRDQTWVRWNVWHSQEPSSKANISLGKPSKPSKPTQDDIMWHPFSSKILIRRWIPDTREFSRVYRFPPWSTNHGIHWHNFEKTWNDICINQAELWNMQQLSLLLLGSLGPLPQQPSKFDAVVSWSLVFKASTNLWQNKS